MIDKTKLFKVMHINKKIIRQFKLDISKIISLSNLAKIVNILKKIFLTKVKNLTRMHKK